MSWVHSVLGDSSMGWPNASSNARPGIYKNGSNWYQVLTHNIAGGSNDTQQQWLRMFKSTDSGATWTAMDTAHEPQILNGFCQANGTVNPKRVFGTPLAKGGAGCDVAQIGTTLHVLYWPFVGTLGVQPGHIDCFFTVKPFDTTTDLWGAAVTSTLPLNGPNEYDPASLNADGLSNTWGAPFDGPNPTCVYNPFDGYIYFHGTDGGLTDQDTFNYTRPYFSRYKPGVGFDANWTMCGSAFGVAFSGGNNGSFGEDQAIIGMGVSQGGRVFLLILAVGSTDNLSANYSHLYLQIIHTDQSLSGPPQFILDEGVTNPIIQDFWVGALQCDCTSVMFTYFSNNIATRWTTLNFASAPISPASDTPTWSFQAVADHSADPDYHFVGQNLFYLADGTRYIISTYTNSDGLGNILSAMECYKQTAGVWNTTVDNIPVNVGGGSTTDPSGGSDEIEFHDFIGIVTAYTLFGAAGFIGTDNWIGTLQVANSDLTCPAPTDITLTFNLHGQVPTGAGALQATNPPSSGPPGPVLNPTECINQQ